MLHTDERSELIGMLRHLEITHNWPTAWAINEARREWGIPQ